jgi:hypothetical protein
MFAAGAVMLDPDPSVLRGIVTLGNQLRYWSYRSGELDVGDKGRKRKHRKGSRGSNANNGTPGGVLRNADLRSYIEDEWSDMKAEERRTDKERQRLIHRFGAGSLGEEEELRLAMALSEETFSKSQSERSTPKPGGGRERHVFDDSEVAEAIRRSLEETEDDSPFPKHSASASPSSSWRDIPIRVAKKGKGSSKSGSRSPKSLAGPTDIGGLNDLELAILLSMEDQGGVVEEGDEYPALHNDSPGGKGKTRAT